MNGKIFYKFMANFYDMIDVIYFRNYENSPRKAVFETVHEKEKILDLCTGTATNAIRIAKSKPTARVVGIDLSEDMLEAAKEKVRKQKVRNLKLYCMDAASLKFKSKCFDKILISLILHELDEALADKVLEEAGRVLKDDGEIVVTEWEPGGGLWRKILFFPIHKLEPESYRAFIKKDLYTYFKCHGFQVVSYTHYDYSRVLRLRKLVR